MSNEPEPDLDWIEIADEYLLVLAPDEQQLDRILAEEEELADVLRRLGYTETSAGIFEQQKAAEPEQPPEE